MFYQKVKHLFFYYYCTMKKTQIFVLILSLFTVKIYSQNLISGKIIDGEFNEPLPFANILIRASSNEANIAGTTSDLDGNFARLYQII